jgi:hypothetical protein
MLEHHVHSPVTRRRLRSGPAAEHVDGFADWLHRHGYKSVSIVAICRSLAGWTEWMQSAGFTVHDCSAGLAACTAELQADGRVRYRRGPNTHSLTAAALFIRFLQECGVLPPPARPASPIDLWPLVSEFLSWMRQHRGLTETTLDVYQPIITELLTALGRSTPLHRGVSPWLCVGAGASLWAPPGQDRCCRGSCFPAVSWRHATVLTWNAVRHSRFRFLATLDSSPISGC